MESKIKSLKDNIIIKKKTIIELGHEIIKLEHKKTEILEGKQKNFDLDDNNGCRVIDQNDRMKILDDMCKCMTEKDFSKYTKQLEGLFWHYSNILYVYNSSDIKCPTWFIEKYYSS